MPYEKIFIVRLEAFLEKHKILSSYQFGFQKNQAIDFIHGELERRHNITGIFLDLSKAFDYVDHQLLLEKLYAYGIRGNAQNWLKSFLVGRKQYVEINDYTLNTSYKSSLLQPQFGIPQGTVVGPILYLIYINSILYDNNPHVLKLMFADETTCLVSSDSFISTEIEANITVNVLLQDFADHNLHLNLKKTHLMHFKTNKYKTTNEPIIILNEQELQCETQTKFLGVFIDQHLSFDFHIKQLKQKLYSGIFVLRQINQISTYDSALYIYHSFIMSHISYGIEIWGGTKKSNLQSIFIIQKRALRYLLKLNSTDSCKSHFQNLNLLTVPSLYIFKAVLLTKRLEQNLPRLGDTHTYNTRNRNTLANVQHRLLLTEQNPIYMGSKFFNALPVEVKNKANTTKFLIKLKLFLVSKAFYSLDEFV